MKLLYNIQLNVFLNAYFINSCVILPDEFSRKLAPTVRSLQDVQEIALSFVNKASCLQGDLFRIGDSEGREGQSV